MQFFSFFPFILLITDGECWNGPGGCPSLLKYPAMESRLHECVFYLNNTQMLLSHVSGVLQCLSAACQRDTHPYTNVLQRLWDCLSDSVNSASGVMRSALCACMLCVADELALVPGSGLPPDTISLLLKDLTCLYLVSPEHSAAVLDFLAVMIQLCRERRLFQLVQDLQTQVEVICLQALYQNTEPLGKLQEVSFQIILCFHGIIISLKYLEISANTTLDKKIEPSPRFMARRTLFRVCYHARSRAISAGQKSHTVADDHTLR